MKDAQNFYINGEWVAPASDEVREVIDPSTEKACASIKLGNQDDTNLAVRSARNALSSWAQSTKKERLDLLRSLLEIYKRRSDEMGAAISQEMGAPIDLALGLQTQLGHTHIEAFIDALESFEFESALSEQAPNDRILFEPVGVCALITPWNWPMNQVTLKVVPALAAGCTMVLKPSEEAPLSSMLFAEFVDEAGFPAGVFNLVNGDGVGVGSQLTNHPDVDFISFTGSTIAGQAISKSAADTVKNIALELGGKGANIIFEDADAEAVERGALHCFQNSGQSCNAPTRMLVHRSRYAEAVQQAAKTAENLRVNLASISGAHMGPVINAAQFSKIQSMIEKGIEDGAKLVAGGLGKPEGFDRGFFVKPTVFADCRNEMSIMQEEVFGPVLSIMPFETEKEAIQIANDTPYGLANYVQTQDLARANRIARQLRSGMVEINGVPRAAKHGAPFGGYKQSGIGREGGTYGLEDFLEVKSIGGWTPGK